MWYSFFFFSDGPLQFSQYAEQQANEITVIHEFVEDNSNCVLLGDFNHGPATPGLSWYLPLNYGLMTARGLLSISATFCGQCTFCNDNILTGGSSDIHIDHIYIPANLISSVRRVMVWEKPSYCLLWSQIICTCILYMYAHINTSRIAKSCTLAAL